METTTYEVQGRVAGPGVSRATCRDATISFDTSGGQGGSLFGPAELLAAALAACLLKNVERFAGLLPFQYRDARVRVVAERRQTPPRMVRLRYELHLVTNEPRQRAELLHRNIRKFGTITNTLARACDLSGELTTEAIPADLSG